LAKLSSFPVDEDYIAERIRGRWKSEKQENRQKENNTSYQIITTHFMFTGRFHTLSHKYSAGEKRIFVIS
jgi:hypothetical protein